MYFERVLVKDILGSSVKMIKELAEKKTIVLDLEIEKLPEGTTAFWEKGRVLQALFNVLDNAVKYTPEGGRIRLTANLVQRSGFSEERRSKNSELRTPNSELHRDYIEISVADTGIGIPKEHLPRIFERFYRVDQDHSRQLGGTGLGLSIVKHIIESYGGTVEVQSTFGKGATFILTIPREPKGSSSK
jgi:two-component system phosphate regulon sensor histidine kinase PhoR